MLSQQKQAAIEHAVNKYPNLPPRAACVADFIETFCTYSKGDGVTQPFVLIPWQYEVLAGMYPGNPGEDRAIRRSLISMARKNGKTEFASALVLVHLCGPESVIRGQIICAAPGNQDQAKHVWEGAKVMAQSHPLLNGEGLMDYRENRIIWKADTNGSIAKTISTKASGVQGLFPSFFVMDEIAEATTRDLYAGLDYADSKNMLGLIISTRSTKVNSLFTTLYNEAVTGQMNGINKHWFVKCWSADESSKNIFTMEQLEAANPAIDVTISRQMLEEQLENAIMNPSARPDFTARRLNLSGGDNAKLVDPYQWDKAARDEMPTDREELYEEMKGKRAVLGVDLGSTTSMTSVAVWWIDEKMLSVRNYMAALEVEKNETLHSAPYRAWADAGYLDLIASKDTGGMTYEPIAEHIAYCYKNFDVVSMRYDGWESDRLFMALRKHDLVMKRSPLAKTLDKFRQGTMSYGPAIIEWNDMLLDGSFKHDGNPCTAMSVKVCEVEEDNRASNPLMKPVKNRQQLPNDAAVSMLMAIALRELVNQPDAAESARIKNIWSNVKY